MDCMEVIGMEDNLILEEIALSTEQSVSELLDVAHLVPRDILVVGCSSSEVQQQRIGSAPNYELGKNIYQAIQRIIKPMGIFIAAQCCEHLNRALVIESSAAKIYGYPRINAVPQ